eukprot:scaffold55738_cov68-Phaeocystis_antarctica.AAC.1
MIGDGKGSFWCGTEGEYMSSDSTSRAKGQVVYGVGGHGRHGRHRRGIGGIGGIGMWHGHRRRRWQWHRRDRWHPSGSGVGGKGGIVLG